MSDNSFRSPHFDLLNRIKAQHIKYTMRPLLYRHLEQNGTLLDQPSYVWMSAGGFDTTTLDVAGEHEVKAAEALIASADLVPTITEYYYFTDSRLRLIQHFDDVRFGYNEDNEVVIFKLAISDTFSDIVITPDSECDAAIEELKKRFHYQKAMADEPIVLRERDQTHTIRPIITDVNVIEIKKRQQQFNAV